MRTVITLPKDENEKKEAIDILKNTHKNVEIFDNVGGSSIAVVDDFNVVKCHCNCNKEKTETHPTTGLPVLHD